MSAINKFWEADMCLAKIKCGEPAKTIGFDVANRRLTIVTHDRTIYHAKIPMETQRYIDKAEVLFF